MSEKMSNVSNGKRSLALGMLLASMFVSRAGVADVIPPGQMTIGDVPVSCGRIPTATAPQLNDTAFFTIDRQIGPVILINPQRFIPLPVNLKIFIYAHECGHGLGYTNEADADCFGVRLGRDQGWLPPDTFDQLVRYFVNTPGDSTHKPGPARVQHMAQCYQTR